jgi:hypothetical protein
MTTESALRRRVAVDKNLAWVGKHIQAVGVRHGYSVRSITDV